MKKLTPRLSGEEVRIIAQVSLGEIARTPKGYVQSSRKGIVAAVLYRAYTDVVFRRVSNGAVQMEVWDTRSFGRDGCYLLPDDLQREAVKMLDAL